jgi:hypothetical protein
MSTPLTFPKRICLDFDGVIHSYTSPWKDVDVIPDPPVPGAFDAIQEYLEANYRVAIYSSRSYRPEGVQAMMRWFVAHGLRVELLDHLEFPCYKPAAQLYIDDRGYHFKGVFPSVEFIQLFRPWNKI